MRKSYLTVKHPVVQSGRTRTRFVCICLLQRLAYFLTCMPFAHLCKAVGDNFLSYTPGSVRSDFPGIPRGLSGCKLGELAGWVIASADQR